MYKFIRYFNQNRRKILSVIITIIFGFILLRFFNFQAGQSNKNMSENTSTTENQVANNNINYTSAITGMTTVSQKATDIIEQFIKYCNEQNVQSAYDMLSNDCKENLYPSLEYFTQNYYNTNFEESKTYKIQNWVSSIFKVDLKENILHTGNVSAPSKQDYMTIVRENEEYKLNINSYIDRTELNKKATIEDIEIQITHKDTFMDYEIYNFEIKNNGNTNIYLDNLDSSSTIYIVDENNIKHIAHAHELAKEQLHIYPYSQKQIKIKFSNRYISGREYLGIVFENAILDENQNEIEKISINLQ